MTNQALLIKYFTNKLAEDIVASKLIKLAGDKKK